MQALRAYPKDAELLKSIGNIYDEHGDRAHAFQYYHDVRIVEFNRCFRRLFKVFNCFF